MAEKWITEEDEYVCKLSPETQEIARKELREDEATRTHALKQMRDWIKSNPRILKCRMDSCFLLRFLRAKKFSCVQAQDALERYILLRQTHGRVFRDLDLKNENVQSILSMGLVAASPVRDKAGRRVIFGKAGSFDPYKYTKEDILRIAGIIAETLMEDEENQVRGYVYFGDAAGAGFPHLTLFTPKEAVRLVKNGEKTLPMRHKEGHGINVLPALKFAVDFGFSLVSDKIKKRIKLYTNLEKAKEGFDCSVLPKEFGGTCGIPMSEMLKSFIEELEAAQPIIRLNDLMEVNEEMYSEQAKIGAVSALKKGFACGWESDMCGISGSFRKLEVD